MSGEAKVMVNGKPWTYKPLYSRQIVCSHFLHVTQNERTIFQQYQKIDKGLILKQNSTSCIQKPRKFEKMVCGSEL